MADSNDPNDNANRDKVEGDRWSAGQTSATRTADRDDVTGNYGDENADNAGGIANRPLDEEVDNQKSLPPRGMNRDESRNHGEDSDPVMPSDDSALNTKI